VPELFAKAGQRRGSYLNDAQWKVFTEGVNRIARRVNDELGLNVVFHHHGAGYVETPDETRELLNRTNADLVGLCLDTGHYHFGGGDAVEAVREFGSRVRYLHLKDCDPDIRQRCISEGLDYQEAVRAGVFCELGQGDVDFPRVIAEITHNGYEGWAIVEQDVLTDDLDAPKASAQRNRDYLRTLGL
jgi:inosose dehydratase